jgi:FixJ family two-component response regulator
VGRSNNPRMADTSHWIAIIDDDPSVLKALSRLLRSHACRAKTYESAQAFLEALPSGLPECLVVDWQMPEMNGLELLEHLDRRGIHVPAIIISAHGDAGARQRCISAGALAFFSKPLQDTELLAAIGAARKITRNSRARPREA